MNAGLILKQKKGEESKIVFLGEETKTYSAETNNQIIEEVKRNEPKVLAADIGTSVTKDEFNQHEEQLLDEGHTFTPTSHEPKKARRMEVLKARLFEEMGADRPEIIRFDPQITADELSIHSDKALESYGINPENINSSEQFDAMLGAITARFYEQNQVKDLGIIIPEPLKKQ